jgi:hypothetical protein
MGADMVSTRKRDASSSGHRETNEKPNRSTRSSRAQVGVINESTVLSDEEVRAAVAVLQRQVSEQFAPVWGVDATVAFVPAGSVPAKGSWWLVVLDNSDQAAALGYHDLTNEGLPLGKVFAASDLQYSRQWTASASHELLEMLADPWLNLAATVEPGRHGGAMTLYAYEVADPCESEEFRCRIDGVLVCDFVYPAWFEGFWKEGQTQFDYLKKIRRPLELLPGGYIGIYDVASGAGWTQLTTEAGPIGYANRPPVGSRRERRRTPRGSWMLSTVRHAATAQPKNGMVRHARVVFETVP